MENVSHFLTHQPGTIHELIRQGNHLAKLNKKIQSLLPDFLQGQFSVAAWEEDTVVIHANNSSVGTVLRYQLLRLLPLLQQDPVYRQVKNLLCHVRQAASVKEEKNVLGHPHYSANAAALLQQTANMISDPKIQTALQRLAQHVQPKNGEKS